jgi:hypothetical protein
MFGAHAAPFLISDLQLGPHFGDVFGRSAPSNHGILMPANIRKVGDLIHLATVLDTASMQVGLRKQVVSLTRRPAALGGRVQEVL